MTFGGWPEISQHLHNEEGLAGALQWHFAAMWLFFVNLLVYLVYGLTSGYFRRIPSTNTSTRRSTLLCQPGLSCV